MLILLILFAIIYLIVKLWKNYLNNNLLANMKMRIKGRSVVLGLLIIAEYIIGAIIIIRIILKLMN